MAVIAIDAGADACKAAVFDGGRMLGYACRYVGYESPESGWAEHDPAALWRLVDRVAQEALSASGASSSVEAICVSVQGDAIMPIDASGEPLHQAILGMDTRSHVEAADIERRFGAGQLYSATGMPCKPLNSITKILWFERNRPDLRKRLWKYVHFEEFLLMKLAGIPAIDFSMASRTMAFDPIRKDWVPSILDYVGIAPGQLGNVTPAGIPVGIIRATVADSWGISRKALLISGGHNQCMAAVGAGVIAPRLASYSVGPTEVIGTPLASSRISPGMLEANYPCYCHIAPDQYFTITLNHSGGMSLRWFHDAILELGGASGDAPHHVLKGVKVWPSPILFLPHLVGSGTPTCDHLSRAAFIGMSIKTRQGDLLQAVVDAEAFEARLNLTTLEQLGIGVSELRAVNWSARMWRTMQIKATVLNRPIRMLRTPEAALAGAAILAQRAIGEFSTLEDACNECVRIGETIEPVASALEAYDDAFERFRPLYGALKSFYQNWCAERQTATV